MTIKDRLTYLYDYVFVADQQHEITWSDVKSLIDIVYSMLWKEVRTEGLWLWPGWRRPTERLLRQWVGFQSRYWDGKHARKKSRLGFYTFTIYDALVCLTACYPKKFGPRGIGHAGVIWIGLQCDIEDEGYAPPWLCHHDHIVRAYVGCLKAKGLRK